MVPLLDWFLQPSFWRANRRLIGNRHPKVLFCLGLYDYKNVMSESSAAQATPPAAVCPSPPQTGQAPDSAIRSHWLKDLQVPGFLIWKVNLHQCGYW